MSDQWSKYIQKRSYQNYNIVHKRINLIDELNKYVLKYINKYVIFFFFLIDSKYVNELISYRTDRPIFTVPEPWPVQKIYYFVPAKIPAVPELFRPYQSKFGISAGNLIPGRNQNL